MPDQPRIFCNTCRQPNRYDITRTFEQVVDDGQIVQWQIIQCRGCESVSFLEKRQIHDETLLPVSSEQVYPPRTIRPVKQFDGIPEKLDQIYKEMIGAFNSKSYILCAGGLRALAEGVCAGQNIKDGPIRKKDTGEYVLDPDTQGVKRGKSLGCKIEELAERHLLTEHQARALHQHRYLGNSALHELEIPGNETLDLAISIIEHAMDTLYNIPAQAGNLNRMRAGAR